MTQPELDFVTGASLALKDSLDTLTPHNHIVQHAANSSLVRVISRPSVADISEPSAVLLISIPQMILPFLHEECIFSEMNIADLLTDPYEPSTPAAGDWTTIDLDLRAPWNLTLADHREFIAGFIVPLIIRLLHLSTAAPDRAIAAKLVAGIPYFRYLAVRTGFLKVSAAKRAAWTTKVLARKVAVLWGRGGVERGREDMGEIEGLRRRVQEAERGFEDVRDEVAQLKEVGNVNNAIELVTIRDALAQVKVVGEANALDIVKIQEVGKAKAIELGTLRDDLAQVKGVGEVNAFELGRIHEELADVKEAGKAMRTEFQTTLETRLAATVEQSLARYTDIVTTKMEQIVSSTLLPPQPNPAPDDLEGPIDFEGPTDFCDLQIYLRLQEGSMTAIDVVNTSPGIHRCFTTGEPTDHVARAVTRGLSSSTPFIVAVTGFSGAGKSFNAFSRDGLLETILGYLPAVEVTVTEILTTARYLCEFRHATRASAVEICQKITQERTSRRTPANDESSRSHLVVSFESEDAGRLFGILLDIAGDEGSADRMTLQDEKTVSNNIALNNADWRKMLWELATPGKGVKGFVGSGGGAGISNYKRVSKLNSEVVSFLRRIVAQKAAKGLPGPMPIVRLLYFVDGRLEGMVAKSLLLINDRCDKA